MDCIFCKIAKGDIPASKIYEDDQIVAFLDVSPANKGHALVIPKDHHEVFASLPDPLLSALAVATKRVAEGIEKALSCHGYNIVNNNRKAAGQVVPHVHIHVIPRHDRDGRMVSWKHVKYSEGEMQEYQNVISKQINF